MKEIAFFETLSPQAQKLSQLVSDKEVYPLHWGALAYLVWLKSPDGKDALPAVPDLKEIMDAIIRKVGSLNGLSGIYPPGGVLARMTLTPTWLIPFLMEHYDFQLPAPLAKEIDEYHPAANGNYFKFSYDFYKRLLLAFARHEDEGELYDFNNLVRELEKLPGWENFMTTTNKEKQ